MHHKFIHTHLLILFAVLCTTGRLDAMSPPNSSLAQWKEAVRSKNWVTALADTSRPQLVPSPTDRIVVNIGGREKVVYQAQPQDVQSGRPIVSPDGSRLAFPKTEDEGRWSQKHVGIQKIYIMDTDGSNLRALIELMPVFAIKGAYIGVQMAWSHDNRSLLFLGTLKGIWDKEPGATQYRTPAKPPEPGQVIGPPRTLTRVDVSSGKTTDLLRFERAVFGDYRSPRLTSQVVERGQV